MKPSSAPATDDTSLRGVRLGASGTQAGRTELKLLHRSTSWFRWSAVLMVLLLSGVTALLALPTPTWLEFMDENAIRSLVLALLVVMPPVPIIGETTCPWRLE
jgi:hypothetical protein